ncbi:choice-of-anchor L domain-containing protein [Flavobacterium selenitireducens]|uniref:choice-of-anchor L domain-containing protein n=1 Tax=Flavobacterium selenitireducens TaxID=2722704 RepID=UPI00168BB384|nr:choice-of-anchor L domain-containing protein [Flavobacterium selenitireducens]MBD3582592.1 T9SS type B sorting domain-containing protein [Flavobacterium selenitireducens]
MDRVWEKFFMVLSFLLGHLAFGQYIAIDEDYTTDQLVNDILIDSPCGQASNIVVTGWNFSSGNTFGYFNANGSTFPFQEGVVLTTGRAASAVGPNSDILSEGPTDWAGDSDLEQALQLGNSTNATVLEFDFLPNSNFFSFNYIFSSEQYLSNPSQNQCGYTDGFAFLLKKANTAEPYQNLAVVPFTDIPVTVNTVRGPGTICPPSNEEYFDAFNDYEHPTNYNGQTKPLTAQAIVEAGVLYHIKIVVADQGNNLYDSAIFLEGGSFRINKFLGDRLISQNSGICPGFSVGLDATETGALSYSWYKNDQLLSGETNPTYLVTAPGTYRVEIALPGGCTGTGESRIEYYVEPPYLADAALVQCDPENDGYSIFDLTSIIDTLNIVPGTFGSTMFFTSMVDAMAGNDGILNPSAYNAPDGTTVIARMAYGASCYVYSTVHLELTFQPASPQTITVCDTDGQIDGKTEFDLGAEVSPVILAGMPVGMSVGYYLTTQDALQQTNPLGNLFTNTTPNQQVIYARVFSGIACYDVVKVTLNVSALQPANFEPETLATCPGQAVTLSVANTFSSYLWSTGETTNHISTTAAGNYSVTVTNADGCTATKSFTVTIPQPPVFVSADISGNDTITIQYSGAGPYVFSIDGQNFQSSPVFENLAGGNYSIYIRDPDGCFQIGPFPVLLVAYPKFFTPNGDGLNDVWRISALSSQPSSKVYIFDRYGKLLHQFLGNGIGWDGKFNSREMPSTDYWFILELEDGRSVKGHFALKR